MNLADKNRFNFDEHRYRMGEINADGSLKMSVAEREQRANRMTCTTVKMFKTGANARPDLPQEIELNAHETHSLDQWRKLGYQTREEIDAPNKATEERIRQAADLVAAVRTIQGETETKPGRKKATAEAE